jgi:hypothetical protein
MKKIIVLERHKTISKKEKEITMSRIPNGHDNLIRKLIVQIFKSKCLALLQRSGAKRNC